MFNVPVMLMRYLKEVCNFVTWSLQQCHQVGEKNDGANALQPSEHVVVYSIGPHQETCDCFLKMALLRLACDTE